MIFTARCTSVQNAVLRSHVVRPSVHLSVTLVHCDHIGWNSLKISSRLVSLGSSVFQQSHWVYAWKQSASRGLLAIARLSCIITYCDHPLHSCSAWQSFMWLTCSSYTFWHIMHAFHSQCLCLMYLCNAVIFYFCKRFTFSIYLAFEGAFQFLFRCSFSKTSSFTFSFSLTNLISFSFSY